MLIAIEGKISHTITKLRDKTIMSNLLKRWMTYFFIPAGLVLLLLPLNTHRSEQIKKDFVFLEITETLIAKTLKEVKPPDFGSSSSGANLSQQVMEYLEESQKVLSDEFSNDITLSNSYGYPIIDAHNLTHYPTLHKHVDSMVQMNSTGRRTSLRPRRLDDVPINEWGAFKNSPGG